MLSHSRREWSARFRGPNSEYGPGHRSFRRRLALPPELPAPDRAGLWGPHSLAARPCGQGCWRASARSVRQSTLTTSAPDCARLSSRCAEPLAYKIFGYVRVAEQFVHQLCRGQLERIILRSSQFACPSIEELNHGRARRDLRFQIFRGGARDALQQFAHDFRFRAQHLLGARNVAARLALDHVTSESPGRCSEADHRDVRAHLFADGANRVADESRVAAGSKSRKRRTAAKSRTGFESTGPESGTSSGNPIASATIKISEKTITASTSRIAKWLQRNLRRHFGRLAYF